MANSLGLVIGREYFERVKRKSFIISTILVPVLMIALMAAPALFMLLGKSEQKTVQVVDNTGALASRLSGNDEITFVAASLPVDSLRADEGNEAILVIGSGAIDDPTHGITLLSRGSVSMMTDAYITGQLRNAIEDARLESYNIPDIKKILADVQADVRMSTVRIDQEKDTETSSEFSYFLALAMDMMLYMFIIIYGQMVMTSIIEEKNNRVLEIVVSSVKPFQLMLGKITGVGLVAITQILIWALLIGTATAVATPFLTPETLGDDVPVEIAGAISQFTEPGFLISLLLYTLLFFIGGFLFYASIYAAIGSAVSNVQDASQLSSIATMPVIIGIIGSMAIMNDPGSTLAFWISVIPFTSPMAMMARLPYGVPGWEIALSLLMLYVAFIFMIWLCGKIYRVGIFMYGKKPTLLEIVKWARYK
ncbi:MAG: ABC transporter permease [Muribaculaceae bacterium]|nr:ABC transporter permease [Muribaculaceae bacterium]